jgi:hypothetical protein
MTKDDWNYFAGLFDGEGHVSLWQGERSSGITVTTMTLDISNNDPRPLLELEEKFGGTVKAHSSGRPDAFRWWVTGNKAVEFAKGILPYTRIKREQLEIYIAFAKLKRRKAMGTTPLTEDELAKRRALIAQLKEIRGARWEVAYHG